jgi:hypothetical protein
MRATKVQASAKGMTLLMADLPKVTGAAYAILPSKTTPTVAELAKLTNYYNSIRKPYR